MSSWVFFFEWRWLSLPLVLHSAVTVVRSTCAYVGGRAYSNAYFGTGTGPIFMNGVQCTSSDSQLLDCFSRPILSSNCIHTADAGVGCEGNFCL